MASPIILMKTAMTLDSIHMRLYILQTTRMDKHVAWESDTIDTFPFGLLLVYFASVSQM